jgi:hypothetical protein
MEPLSSNTQAVSVAGRLRNSPHVQACQCLSSCSLYLLSRRHAALDCHVAWTREDSVRILPPPPPSFQHLALLQFLLLFSPSLSLRIFLQLQLPDVIQPIKAFLLEPSWMYTSFGPFKLLQLRNLWSSIACSLTVGVCSLFYPSSRLAPD